MKAAAAPLVRDIVLLGGGHAHVQVLKAFGMRPEPGLRLTLLAREPHSPYSGMLPGLIAGSYGFDDIHIDLARLAAFAQARFIAAEATGIDLAARRIAFDDRPPLRYDVLSLNTGGVPGERFASDFVTPVKPIGRFLPAWQRLIDGDLPRHLTVAGAGAGGIELALAITARYDVRCTVVDAADAVLPTFAALARRRLLAMLRRRGVDLLTGFRVREAGSGEVVAEDGRRIATDHVLWVTGVEAPPWPRQAGLATAADGFVAVNAALQSTSHPEVFAAGDIAASMIAPRPKSGVYAVRQGPVLTDNLRRFATGRGLRPYRAQRRAMAMLGDGAGTAVASRGRLAVAGRWVWRWKRWIDRRFIAKFNELPSMPAPPSELPANLAADAPEAMRCGGCGAKLGADILHRVLDRLDICQGPATIQGIGDDAAVVRVGGGTLAVSCDGFRAMIDDAYRFGRIGAHHALNDLFAMGATPTFALALATVPAMADAMMEEDLYQMMAGALAVFRDHGVDLVGGHSAEGAELGIAFSVAGALSEEPLAKGGLRVGQRLVLSKPIGTGALLAAAMQGRAPARDMLNAIGAMDASNAAAVRVLRACGASACTDVTGFGLIGHLAEMVRASGREGSLVGVELWADQVPRLTGALAALDAGVASSLQANNEQALEDFELRGAAPNAPTVRLLADPQTSGGLLAAVPAHSARECVAALRQAGYPQAAVIGCVLAGDSIVLCAEKRP